ncbi:uncharacterized protein RHOBADRAFT_50976 [Rhodotorula graminis WP1]|uniref:Suppressor of forked domain-containing protein n=1 Tax=Rhodotorula graminis (strain WP1) TaxID=578459 RepID=A0A194SD54_RHOGW|nr:uncharacterized protein RHOBADRAFT_50976 [Rhodotorula graminis WP1]KPV78517.1 hypothetical protein RHOBADRAFT_50976 [Rhodotorula graminis WP1]
MAGGAPPPSFSSFPDTHPPKPPAPAFSSYPSPPLPPRSTSPPPSKRSRATDFLDNLGTDLGISASESRSSCRRHGGDDRPTTSSRRRHDDDRDRDRDERRKPAAGSSRRDDGERERGKGGEHGHRSRRDDRDERRHGERERRRDDDGSRRRHDERRSRDKGKGKERDLERDSDYGPKRSKPYQLVQALNGGEDDALPVVVRSSRVNEDSASDKPLFYESRRGDENNLRYGGLHRGDVPKYRRLGGGRVVGLNEGLRITRETAYTGRGVEISPLNRFRTPRYTDSSSFRHLTDKNTKRLTLQPRSSPHALGEPALSAVPPDPFLASADDDGVDFVGFDRERTTAEKLERLEHEDGTDYRSVAGLIKPADLADAAESDDDLFAGLGISGGESHAERLRRKNIELDRALRDNPRDVARWLEFVDLQDEIAQSSFAGGTGGASSTKRALSKGERASTSEVKLAILVRALAVPDNAEAELLILAQLRAAAEVEEPQRVLARWKDALREHPRLTGLWIEYVSWRQTTWATFSVKDVVGVFAESFEVLVDAMEGEDPGSSGREMLESNAIYLFLRFCLMLRQAGFAERALAAFQALVELNLLRPPDLERLQYERTMPWRERVFSAFESFWDGEAPRIGESGAKGWRATTEDDLPPEPVESSSAAVALVETDASLRPHERWALAERAAAASSRRPARATDVEMDDSEDPYRVVLFDDVKPFLFLLSSPESTHQLAYAFLAFLGLPFVPPDVPTSTPFTTDPFVHSELVERPSLLRRYWPARSSGAPFGIIGGEAMEPERDSALKAPWNVPFKAMPATVDTLFGGPSPGWFKTLGKEDLLDLDLDLARNALALLRQALPDDTFLTLDAFSLEAVQGPKAAVKLAKQVLRDHRNDLALWDAYARIERQRGKATDARQVYCTALSMYRSFKPQDQIEGPLLWRAWAEMEWEDGRTVVALKVLVAAASKDIVDLASLASTDLDARPSAPQLLRARQHYTHDLEAAFQPHATQALVRNRNHLAFSFALLQYLTGDLAAAGDVLERHLFRLDCAGATGSAEHEEALMMFAKLLFRHSVVGGGYRPAQLRELLERALGEFKNNSIFLALFYHNEQRMKIENHFRRLMEEKVLKESEATSEGWLFAIFAELHRDARSTNVWAVRNLFDRAVDNPRSRSSASVWALYVDFEVRNGELARAKSLIYRALRECPWCKEFYLRPFSPAMRPVFRSRELRDFHHLLLEKGLRVHVDIDRLLDGAVLSDMDDDGGEDQEDGSERLEAAGEEVLTERTRLMPY